MRGFWFSNEDNIGSGTAVRFWSWLFSSGLVILEIVFPWSPKSTKIINKCCCNCSVFNFWHAVIDFSLLLPPSSNSFNCCRKLHIWTWNQQKETSVRDHNPCGEPICIFYSAFCTFACGTKWRIKRGLKLLIITFGDPLWDDHWTQYQTQKAQKSQIFQYRSLRK